MRQSAWPAVLAVVFALTSGAAACSDASDESEATVGSPPGSLEAGSPGTTDPEVGPVSTNAVDVFSFATDDLCEWVSAAEVADWIASEFDWQGTATEVAPADETVSCEWTLEGVDAGEGYVSASDAAGWREFSGAAYDFEANMAEAGVTAYEQGPLDIGAWVVAHPAMSDGVVVHNGGFGQFAFGVPPGPWLQVSMVLDYGDTDTELSSEDYEAHYFAVADRFLQELGWVS